MLDHVTRVLKFRNHSNGPQVKKKKTRLHTYNNIVYFLSRIVFKVGFLEKWNYNI